MARLPGPRGRTVFTRIPDVVDTGAGSAFAGLAQGLSAVSEVLQPLAEQQAAALGAEAVSIGPDGLPQAETRTPFTQIDRIYNEAARSIYVTEMEGQVTNQIISLANEYQDDPAGFVAAAQQYRGDLMDQVPTEFKGDVALILGSRVNAANSRLVTQGFQRTQTRAVNANRAALDRNNNRIQELSGLPPTEENEALLSEAYQERSDLLTSRQNLPGSTYTPEQAALDLETTEAQAARTRSAYVATQAEQAIDIYEAGSVPVNADEIADLVAGTEYERDFLVAREMQQLYPDFANMTPAQQQAIIDERNANPAATVSEARATAELEDIADDTRTAEARALDGRLEEAIDILEAGGEPRGLEQLRQEVAGTDRQDALDVAVEGFLLLPVAERMSPQELDAFIADRQSTPARSVKDVEITQALQERRQETVQAIQRDPLAHAQQQGLLNSIDPFNPLDPSSVRERIARADALAADGRNPQGRLFTNEEAAAIRDGFTSDDPNARIEAINSVANFGPAASRAAGQLDLDVGQNYSVQMTILGLNSNVINQSVTGAALGNFDLDDGVQQRVSAEFFGTMLDTQRFGSPAEQATFQEGLVETAEGIYAYRSQDRDLNPRDSERLWRESLEAASGRSGTVGGIQRVNGYDTFLPPTVDRLVVDGAVENWRTTYFTAIQGNPDDIGDQRVDLSILGQGTRALSAEEVQARQDQFWSGVSLGGAPDITREQISDTRIVMLNPNTYSMEIRSRGRWVPVRDRATGVEFRFNMNRFMERGQ